MSFFAAISVMQLIGITARMDYQKMADWHTLSRLYVSNDLTQDGTITPSTEQAHYLTRVMRLVAKDKLRVFNGKNGEWLAEIAEISKKSISINILEQIRPQSPQGNLWLCSAPIKKAHYEYLIEKATELGVSDVIPLLTSRTQVREVNVERLGTIAIESAEQSERLDIPAIKSAVSLEKLLSSLPADVLTVVCAEWGDATPVAEAFTKIKAAHNQNVAIITGPEGGFTKEELETLRRVNNSIFIRLGSRILRADTAAIAALSCWQAIRGDWNSAEK